MDQSVPQAHYYMTAPEFKEARERLDQISASLLSVVIKPSLVDQLIQKILLEIIHGIQETAASLFLVEKYFAVFVVHTGHFQKILSRNIFKSGTPSELLFASH